MVGASSSMKSRTLCLRMAKMPLSFAAVAMVPLPLPLPALDLGAQPQQRILGGDQLAPRLVDPLLLAFDKPPVRGDRLVDPFGRLPDLLMHLAGEAVPQPGAQVGHAPAELRGGLAPLAGDEVEPAHRERGGQQDAR